MSANKPQGQTPASTPAPRPTANPPQPAPRPPGNPLPSFGQQIAAKGGQLPESTKRVIRNGG